MIDVKTYEAILDSVNSPIVFVDTEHIIRYLNKPAKKRYYEQRGYSDLIGKSVFDYHKPESRAQITELYTRLQRGENEIFLKVNKDDEKVTVVAVRDIQGKLLGYYERFEKAASDQSPPSQKIV